MKVAFYRRGKANTELVNETDCIRPNLLITDMYKMYSVCARELLFFYEDENISEEALLSWAPSIMSHDKIGLEVTETIRKVLPEINRTRLLKHKTKEDLVLLGRFSALIKGMKKQFILNIDYRLKKLNLKNLTPFEKDNIWELKFLDENNYQSKEHYMITELTSTLIERQFILELDTSVEKLFTHMAFDEANNNQCDFIKIPLWNIPFLFSMNYLQMKYTRDNLMPILLPFKAKLKELSEELIPILFIEENMERIRQLSLEKFIGINEPVQKAIDEDIYITKSKNKIHINAGMKFCLGITSTETLINYFEKTNNIEPYMSGEIKMQIGRHVDLKASNVFVYYDIHNVE